MIRRPRKLDTREILARLPEPGAATFAADYHKFCEWVRKQQERKP